MHLQLNKFFRDPQLGGDFRTSGHPYFYSPLSGFQYPHLFPVQAATPFPLPPNPATSFSPFFSPDFTNPDFRDHHRQMFPSWPMLNWSQPVSHLLAVQAVAKHFDEKD